MHEYDDQVRPYVVLRRIIIVVAVLTAVPVALWTVTGFVRTYVGPPKLPTFRQLATTAAEQQESTGATRAAGDQPLWQAVTTFVHAHVAVPQLPSVGQLTATLMGDPNAKPAASDRTRPAAEQARPPAPSPLTVEARATATDARDLSGSSKEPPANDVNVPANTTKITDASPTPMIAKSADMPVTIPVSAQAADTSRSLSKPDATAPNAWPPAPQQNTTSQTNAPWPPAQQTHPTKTLSPAAQTAAADESATDVISAKQPLTGRIPLPRRRPSDLAMVQITAANVPMPRPRPELAGSAAPSETATGVRPLDFLSNLFH
jgi:hypothetical protein